MRKFLIYAIFLTITSGSFSSQAAILTGKVNFTGKPVPPRRIDTRMDKKCTLAHGNQPIWKEDFVLNKNGTLRWCLVYIKNAPKAAAKPGKRPTFVLDQQTCMYMPHVFAVMTGQPVEIRNSDPFLHNVHCVARKNRGFNFAQPMQGLSNTVKFTKPEMGIKFQCDVHPWMAAYCFVFDHPYFAVTGPAGAYTIKDLPPGTYSVTVWHETLGSRTQQLTVKAGEKKTLDFTYKR